MYFISSIISNPPKKEEQQEKNENKNNEMTEGKGNNNNEISEKNEIDNSQIIKNSSKQSSTNSITKIIYLPSNNSIDTSFDDNKRTISNNYFTKNTDTSRSNMSQFPLQNNSLNLKKKKK